VVDNVPDPSKKAPLVHNQKGENSNTDNKAKEGPTVENTLQYKEDRTILDVVLLLAGLLALAIFITALSDNIKRFLKKQEHR